MQHFVPLPYLYFRAANRAALTAKVVSFPDLSDEKLRTWSDLIPIANITVAHLLCQELV